MREVRDHKKLTIQDLSRETGLSLGLISEAESGKNKPSPNLLFAFAKKYGININWLLANEGEMLLQAEKLSNMSGFQLVPEIGPAACGSSGRILDDEIKGFKAFEIMFLKKYKNPCLTRAQGDSMLPVIQAGDLLLCDRNSNKRLRPDSKHLYLVNNPDDPEKIQVTVKKLSFSGQTLTLIPLNPAYSPTTMDVHGKSILDVVLGQIVWIGRELE